MSTPFSRPRPDVLADQRPPEEDRHEADRQVDEEDPVPVDRLGQGTAGQQADRAAADDHEHVGAHRLRPLDRQRELGDDDREDHRDRQRTTDALDEAGGDQEGLAAGEAADGGGEREEEDAAEEDPLASDEVTEPSGHQQEAAEGDQVGVDHPGEARLREVEVVLDRRQGDVHDGRVEDAHQLAETDDEERDPAAAVACEEGTG